MRGIDKDKLIQKHKNKGKLYDLQDGSGEVLGQEVDLDNRLVYVVRRKGKLEVVSNKEVKIVEKIYQTPGQKRIVIIPR